MATVPRLKIAEPTSRENTQRVQEGDSIKLKVVSTFDVKPNQFRLIHDGAPVDLKKRSSIIIERVSAGTYAVSLLNLRVSDSGLYEYQIEGAPTPKHLVKLYVEPRPIKEKTLHVPQTTFNVGESILFKIDFDEKDQITEIPKWYKNEMIIPIDTSSRHKQTIDRINRTHTFEIYNLQLEDSGVYEMRTPNLTVKTPEIKIIPQPVQKPVEEEIRPTQQTVRQSSLTIDMKKPKEQLVESRPVEEFQLIDENIPIHEVTEGDMMHLTVEKPSTVHLSDIKLFKNNQPLVSSKNIHVESTSPTTIDIKFSPVELIDTGFYSIKIRDQIQPIMQLNVREKPIQRQIMNLPQDTFIENETLTIECKFDSKPDAKFVWTKDGSILYNDSRIIIKQKNETFTLIIKDLKLSDQGVYSLESKYLILDTPFIHILPKQQQPTVQIQHDETAVTMQPSVTVADKEDKIEEIKIKEQPLEQTPAPTAFIESAKKKPDETITTTTTVEQQQEPSVQVSSSAVKPKQPTEDISVQTQQSVPVEQVVEVKTTTVEETQPQPTVTVTEQQEQIIEQPIVTPVEQPKPSVETQQEKEQEQAVKTTTQVEEQPVPQVTTDALSAQPKTEEQTILTTDMTTTQEQISPAVTTEQEVIQTEKPQSIVTTEKQIETVEKRPEVEKPIVEQTITKAEETTITRDITPLIEDITKERRPIAEQPTVSEQAVTVTEEIQQKEKAPAEEQPKEETSKPSQTVVEETTTIVQHDTIVEEDKPAKIESTTEVTKVEETLPEVSITTVQKQMKRVEEQQLTSIEKPTFEQTITTETISTDKELPTTSPVIEETQRPTEKLSTTEETIQETKVPIEEQPKYTIETTFTEEEVIEETPKVPTDIVEEKSETKPTEQITTVVEEETTIEKEKPLTDQLTEEKPKVEETASDMPTTTTKEETKPGEETITTEEITTTEAIPTVQETITTTEEIIQQDVSPVVDETQKPTEKKLIVEKVTSTEEVIEEKPKIPTTTTEEMMLISVFYSIYEVQSGPLIVRTPHINVIERSHDITEIVDETITYTITPNRPLPPVEAKVCTIKEGDDVTLKISSPTPITINDVQLYKNGQPIPTDNETRKHLRLEQFGNKDVRLTIKDARLIDTGEYSALINDNIQPIIKLDVQPRDMQIQMINLPQDTFNEGETLKIDCRFPHSNINTDYQWYKDNQPLIPNDRIVMRKDAFNDSLVIVNLQPTDAGVYELRSRNNILRTPLIKVIPSDKKINIEELRPQVSSKLVHEGDTVTFELTPNFDVPLNKIELFHEENPITHEPYVHMKKDYKTNSITVQIEDIKIPDHGLYTAIVQGQSVPLAELIVEQRPTIIQNMDLPKDVFYTDERLELECEFPQVPKGDQPKWFKNNQPLQSTLNVHLVTENQGRKHSLIIDHLKPEDTGQYELRVKGLIVRTPLIRVIQREQPQIEEQPSPYIVTEAEDGQDKFKLKPEPPQRRISNVVIEDITNQPSAP
ncbi:unnamed protein product, partial [Rotaria sp. Silwood1]